MAGWLMCTQVRLRQTSLPGCKPRALVVPLAYSLHISLLDLSCCPLCAEERLQFIHLLQHFATSKHLRVSILSGDAHVGGVGRLYSKPKYKNIG